MIADGWLERLQRRRPLRSPQRAVRSGPVPRPRASSRSDGRRRGRLLRLRPRVVVGLIALVALLGGAWLWLRDSQLVSVEHVHVSGQSGPDAAQIRSALVAAAHNMTTLDVRMSQLRTAVAPYPVVKDLRVSTQFPHGMRIRVIEQVPVGAVMVAGRTIAVAGDGTLLHDVVASASLPTIPLRVPPGGPRLSEPDALHAVEVLAAAPYQLLSRISQVSTVASHGLVAQLRSGPSIYFGDATRLAAKWTAAAAVLADSGSVGAVYIDVTDPQRPAAGADSATAGGTSAAGAGAGAGAASGTVAPVTGGPAGGANAAATSGASAPAAAGAASGAGTPAAAGPAATGSGTSSTTPSGG